MPQTKYTCADKHIRFLLVPGVCYAEGMAKYPHLCGIWLFDYPRFAEPPREAACANLDRLAAEHGLTIEFVCSAGRFATRTGSRRFWPKPWRQRQAIEYRDDDHRHHAAQELRGGELPSQQYNRMIHNSITRLVAAGSKTIAAVKLAPLRKMARASRALLQVAGTHSGPSSQSDQ